MTTVRFQHDGGSYEFQRGTTGEGRWVCIRGKCLGIIGENNPGIVVPLMHEHELSTLAIEAGVANRENLRRFIPKPQPEPKVKRAKSDGTKRRVVKRKDGVIGGLSLADLMGA